MVTFFVQWVLLPMIVGILSFLIGHWRGGSDERLALKRDMPILDHARRILRDMPEDQLAIVTAHREDSQIIGVVSKFDMDGLMDDDDGLGWPEDPGSSPPLPARLEGGHRQISP